MAVRAEGILVKVNVVGVESQLSAAVRAGVGNQVVVGSLAVLNTCKSNEALYLISFGTDYFVTEWRTGEMSRILFFRILFQLNLTLRNGNSMFMLYWQ